MVIKNYQKKKYTRVKMEKKASLDRGSLEVLMTENRATELRGSPEDGRGLCRQRAPPCKGPAGDLEPAEQRGGPGVRGRPGRG